MKLFSVTCDQYRNTALILAASRGNKEIVGFLLDKKADSINDTNNVSNIMLDKRVITAFSQ